jgi:hypothetical protein
MAFTDQASNSQMRSKVAAVWSAFLTKVSTKRLALVVPVPKRPFHETTISESCFVKAPASPCRPKRQCMVDVIQQRMIQHKGVTTIAESLPVFSRRALRAAERSTKQRIPFLI